MNKPKYKELYDEAVSRLAVAERDADYWHVRADATAQEIFELRTKLFEAIKLQEETKTQLVETEAKVPTATLQTDNENLRRINGVYKQIIFGGEPTFFQRFRLFLLGLPVKLKNESEV